MDQFQSVDLGKIKKGIVFKTSKFGLIVKSEGKTVFIPASLSAVLRSDEWSDEEFEAAMHHFLNKCVTFQLMQLNSRVVGSISDVVTLLKQTTKSIFFSDVYAGAVYEGRIEMICQYGVFVDIGNVTVFVHKAHLLNPGECPLDFYIPGNRIVVRVNEIDYAKGRISGEEYYP